VAEVLAEAAEGTIALDPAASRHVERCQRCQAEIVQYRKLLRALHTLRTEVLEPTPGLLTDILAGLVGEGERHAVRSMLRGRRMAYVGGIAAATAAAGAGAILIAAKSRKAKVRLAS
jgi:hypothetical protein